MRSCARGAGALEMSRSRRGTTAAENHKVTNDDNIAQSDSEIKAIDTPSRSPIQLDGEEQPIAETEPEE